MKLAIEAAKAVAAELPPGARDAFGIAVQVMEFVLNKYDAWAEVEMRRQMLANEARVDAEALAAFGVGVRKTEPPPPPDTIPGDGPGNIG